jgi:hypothetical protein
MDQAATLSLSIKRRTEQNGEEFPRINPRRQVPVLDVDGTFSTLDLAPFPGVGHFPHREDPGRSARWRRPRSVRPSPPSSVGV